VRVGIVGAGPAGVAAAVFLRRYNVHVTVFEKNRVGGLLRNAHLVENIPVLPPASGEEICKTLEKRLFESGAELIWEEVVKVENEKILTEREIHSFDYVIVASGTIPRRIPEFEVSEKVVYEFIDLPEFEKLAIYGAGDAAFDSALNALVRGKEVHLFNRGSRIRALPLLVERAKKYEKFYYHERCPILKVEEESKMVKLKTEHGVFTFDALLLSVGRLPNTSFVEPGERNFIVGDARGGFRQVSIAMGSAIETAMEILRREGTVSATLPLKEGLLNPNGEHQAG